MEVEGPSVGDELWDFGTVALAGSGVCNYTGSEECVWQAEA